MGNRLSGEEVQSLRAMLSELNDDPSKFDGKLELQQFLCSKKVASAHSQIIQQLMGFLVNRGNLLRLESQSIHGSLAGTQTQATMTSKTHRMVVAIETTASGSIIRYRLWPVGITMSKIRKKAAVTEITASGLRTSGLLTAGITMARGTIEVST